MALSTTSTMLVCWFLMIYLKVNITLTAVFKWVPKVFFDSQIVSNIHCNFVDPFISNGKLKEYAWP